MTHGSLFSGIGGCGVYMIMNTLTNDFYLGSSANIRKRVTAHLSQLRGRNHSNLIMQRSFNKYGESAFDFKVIEITNIDSLIKREEALVQKHKPSFNIRKVVESNRGIKLSDETKKKMSVAKAGKPLSDAQKQNLHILHTNRIGKPVTGMVKDSLKLGPLSRIGKPVSEKTREKIRQSKLGIKFNKLTGKYE